jgi:predicted secreted protein
METSMEPAPVLDPAPAFAGATGWTAGRAEWSSVESSVGPPPHEKRTRPKKTAHEVEMALMNAQTLFLIVALCLACGTSCAFGSEPLSVNKDFHGKSIEVNVGNTIRVELEQLGAAGYEWEIQELDADHFELLSVETVDRPDAGELVGAPVLKRWLIRAKEAGDSELRLLHYRVWEGRDNALDTFVVKVLIHQHP